MLKTVSKKHKDNNCVQRLVKEPTMEHKGLKIGSLPDMMTLVVIQILLWHFSVSNELISLLTLRTSVFFCQRVCIFF